MKPIVILLPCLNEENTISTTIYEIKKLVKNSIIIVLDDASTDSSISKLNKADRIILVQKRVCLSELVRIGFKESKKYNPEFVVHFDSDGQHNPSDINKLLKILKMKNADMIIGSRFLNNNPKMSILKKWGNKFFTNLINHITGLKLTDAQSGLRIMRFDLINKIKLISNYTYTHEEILLTMKLKGKIIEAPIKIIKRKFSGSRVVRNPFKYFFYALWDIIKIWR